MRKLYTFLLAGIAISVCAQNSEPVEFKTDGLRFVVNTDVPTTVTLLPAADTYGESGKEFCVPSEATNAATGITYVVTGIGEEAFTGSRAPKISIPSTITAIHGKAFWGSWLSEIVVDEANPAYMSAGGVLYNKEMTRLCCFPPEKGFDGFELPQSVTALGDYAFCSVWLTAFDVPERVTSIGEGAFMDTRLKSMEIPSTVTTLGGAVFQNCKSLQSVVFPEGMTLMPDHVLAFSWMLKSVNLPSTLTRIGSYAFNSTFVYGSGSNLLSEIVVPDNVTYIECGAFQGCRGLSNLTLGKRVAEIDLYAFAQCSGLQTITSLNTVPPVCLDFDGNEDEVVNTFAEVPSGCVLYVPAESVEDYVAKWGYKFKDIRPLDASGVDEVNAGSDIRLEINVANGTLSVASPSAVMVYSSTGTLVAEASDGVLSQQLPCGIYIVCAQGRAVKVAVR